MWWTGNNQDLFSVTHDNDPQDNEQQACISGHTVCHPVWVHSLLLISLLIKNTRVLSFPHSHSLFSSFLFPDKQTWSCAWWPLNRKQCWWKGGQYTWKKTVWEVHVHPVIITAYIFLVEWELKVCSNSFHWSESVKPRFLLHFGSGFEVRSLPAWIMWLKWFGEFNKEFCAYMWKALMLKDLWWKPSIGFVWFLWYCSIQWRVIFRTAQKKVVPTSQIFFHNISFLLMAFTYTIFFSIKYWLF